VVEDVTYASLLTRYENALAWYASLGAAIHNSRLHLYQQTLRSLIAGHEDPEPLGLADRERAIVNTLFEVNQHCDIYKGLAGRHDDHVKDRISFVPDGPWQYTDERPSTSSNRGRNVVFELVVASWLARSGFEIVREAVGDLTLRVDDAVIALECKRPQSGAGFERAVKDAGRQVRHRLKRYRKSYVRGLVAVEVTKIINPRFGLLIGSELSAGMVIPPFLAGLRSGKRSCSHRQLLPGCDAA